MKLREHKAILEDKKFEEKHSFSALVLRYAREIPPGYVTTYGALARAAGGGGMAARSITGILSKAWNNGVHDIPFHRIVYSGGKIWTDARYDAERLRLYKKEKLEIVDGKIKDFAEKEYKFR